METATNFVRPDRHRLYGVTHSLDGTPILRRMEKSWIERRKKRPFEYWISNAFCGYCGSPFLADRQKSAKAKAGYATYCSPECLAARRLLRTGENAPCWKGGIIIDRHGYRALRMPEHPRSHNGYVSEHIVIAELALGKPLPERAEVHHVNQVRSDNSCGNLVICQDRAYHLLVHARTRIVLAGGHPDVNKICGHCKQLKLKVDFVPSSGEWDGRQNTCRLCCHENYINKKLRTINN